MTLSLDSLGVQAKSSNDAKDDTKSGTSKLSDRQKIIYKIISSDDTNDDTNSDTNLITLSSAAIAEELGVSTITVKRELSKMVRIGVIKHVGPPNGGHWEIIKE